ncbi:MAG: gephyrin-like molybdotransferase Glp [Ferruginibacter sp.]
MITVDEAKKIIREEVKQLSPALALVSQAAGLVLASDVYADSDIPAFAQSSMDGYAISFAGWQSHKTLQISGEVPAGSGETISFSPHQATRIFTGAPVPDGADTVVMQEKVKAINGELFISDDHLTTGLNVRPKGAEIKAGEIALRAGTVLSPAAIGFLTGIGITNVVVYPKPVVGIIVTGKELQQPGKPLLRGQVYESNSYTLTAALQQQGIKNVKIYWADDNLEILKTVLETALVETELVLLTGGISVGDYDFVLQAATQCGITKLFHRLKQRPGKPLYFGKKDNRPVFGLPGNPSSVLTCFYEYVLPALQQLSNQKNEGLKILKAPLAGRFEKAAGLTHFLKGYFDGEKVTALEAQESYRLSSFAKANCLIRIGEGTISCQEGEEVEIHLLPAN